VAPGSAEASNDPADVAAALPEPFAGWFAGQGWTPRPHQLALLAAARQGRDALLIAPTGAGKTLAGFLPSLVRAAERARTRPNARAAAHGVRTLYLSPLKALAVDVARNLERPVAETGLAIAIETRTGDTSVHKRRRQKLSPPDVLLTTPEQLALLISAKDAARFFEDLEEVVLDELHSLVTSKRGDLLALGLARLRRLAPRLRVTGLSATVADPDGLAAWIGRVGDDGRVAPARIVEVGGGAKPEIRILDSDERVPWAGHSAAYAVGDVYDLIRRHKTTLVFVNTRSQAERVFHELWSINDDTLPIALHHGSLDRERRRRVEAAMAANRLRAIVCTSTLDLGIDWGDVDLVIHVGAPKGASRLAQRIGRSNHRLDEPSQAVLVPANRFEVLECRAALDGNYLGAQDTPPLRDGALDVLAQHVLGMACAGPFDAEELYAEILGAWPYRRLDRESFESVVDFVATGGYALRSYERFAKIRRGVDGRWRLTHPRFAEQYRLNVGTIIETPLVTVRLVSRRSGGPLRGGRVLGQLEEYFLDGLAPGDTFLFAGEILKLEGMQENDALVSLARSEEPKIPIYAGGKFPLTTYLAGEVRAILADPDRWARLPQAVAEWLALQNEKSVLPPRDGLLVESFPHRGRSYMVAYPFEGRLAHQTLGMLLTRRLDRAGLRPIGFVASDYAIGVWAAGDLGGAFLAGKPSIEDLFDADMLGDDLEEWMAESHLLKRSFRSCALIAGLIERRHPGKEKTGRQVTISTDLVYDVLRSHDPDHILLRATREEASRNLLDLARLGEMLSRIRGRIMHKPLERVSPLALPVLIDIGREGVAGGDTEEAVLADAEAALVHEAIG
jgi:ATP-dependent Lhr-like helicase